MAKISLQNLANLQNETTAVNIINANNDAIEVAMEKTLSRDGTVPNQMTSELDMNSQRIINLTAPLTDNEPARLVDLTDIVFDAGTGNVVGPASAVANNVAIFAGTSGKLIADGGANLASKANLAGDTFTGPVVFDGTSAFNNTATFNNTVVVNSATVDVTSWDTVGDLKHRYGTGTRSGWVRCNGRTLGSASSGATERANADTQTLFIFLWDNNPNLTVSSGRGANAAADWAANKNIALPDFRGRTLSGLDDMGNSAASILTSTYLGTSATVLGASGGSQSHTLTSAQIPAHTHPNTLNDLGHTHNYDRAFASALWQLSGGGAAAYSSNNSTASSSNTTGITITNAANTGGDGAHNNIQPTSLVTIYIKL